MPTLRQIASPLLSVEVPIGLDPDTQEPVKVNLMIAASEFTLKLQRQMTDGQPKTLKLGDEDVEVPPDVWIFCRLVKDWDLTEEPPEGSEPGTVGPKLPITLETLDGIEMPRLATINQTIMAVLLPNLKPSQPSTES